MKPIATGSIRFPLSAALLLLLLLPLSGCNKHVVYVHNASLGVDVNFSTESGTAKLSFGYDRETFAVVPQVTSDIGDGKNSKTDAMSLVSVSNVDAVGLQELIFNHAVATGAAAVTVAKDPEGLKAMRKAVFGEEGQ